MPLGLVYQEIRIQHVRVSGYHGKITANCKISNAKLAISSIGNWPLLIEHFAMILSHLLIPLPTGRQALPDNLMS
jgi:hypothetical protein